MLHKKILLSTSNEKKIAEFKSYNLDFEVVKGVDLKEIDSTSKNVVIQKAIDAGEKVLVEDTVLIIDGKEVVDIKWKIKELRDLKNPKIEWITSLAIVDDGFVYVYQGYMECSLAEGIENATIPEDAFGFDPYLVPSPNGIAVPFTFYELAQKGLKSGFSPRRLAVNNLLAGYWLDMINIDNIEPWTGGYQ